MPREDGEHEPVSSALDGWMRRDVASVHARLIKRFGWGRADTVEDAIQHALVRALERWPFSGVPDRPSAWLFTVASNRILDTVRSATERRVTTLDAVADHVLATGEEVGATDEGEVSDAELEVLFALAHPALDLKSGIALTLQVMCGFTLREIASALLMKPDAVAQKLRRAKRTLRGIPDVAALPTGDAIQARLAVALDVIALLFNEGFEPSSGERAMRPELCAEALRLADALARHQITATTEAQALAALLNLLFARLPARVGARSAVTLLAEQDRSEWSQTHLRRGFEQLRACASGARVSRYHLLAGIAATHAAATSLEDTDWDAIVASYRLLIELEDSPVHRLNYAVALQRAGSTVIAGEEIEELAELPEMRGYFWFHVTQAEIRRELGDHERSLRDLAAARTLARTAAQSYSVQRKIDEIEGDVARLPSAPG